jgi:hypothetical protein
MTALIWYTPAEDLGGPVPAREHSRDAHGQHRHRDPDSYPAAGTGRHAGHAEIAPAGEARTGRVGRRRVAAARPAATGPAAGPQAQTPPRCGGRGCLAELAHVAPSPEALSEGRAGRGRGRGGRDGRGADDSLNAAGLASVSGGATEGATDGGHHVTQGSSPSADDIAAASTEHDRGHPAGPGPDPAHHDTAGNHTRSHHHIGHHDPADDTANDLLGYAAEGTAGVQGAVSHCRPRAAHVGLPTRGQDAGTAGLRPGGRDGVV